MPPDTPPAHLPTGRPRRATAAGPLALALAAGHARAEEAGGGTEALAKQAQNPIADLISVPFQDNVDFGVGERGRTQNVLNFQPGDDDRRPVNQMLIQPFVNYNFGGGWYLASSPVITADWEAKQGKNIWTVPVGGGFGRLFRAGKLPVNTSVQAFDDVESPEFGTDWTLRLQVQFLFPK